MNSFLQYLRVEASSAYGHLLSWEEVLALGQHWSLHLPSTKLNLPHLQIKLFFVEALRPIAPCSGTSALSTFVERFTTTELCKLFPIFPFGPEKLALTWKIFFVTVSLCSKQFRQIVPNSLSRGNTSPRRSSRLWQVFVFCFPENNFLRNAELFTSLPHCNQMFSGTATWIKVLVYFPPPFHYQTIDRFREVRKVFRQFDRQRRMQHPEKLAPKWCHLTWFSARETSRAFARASRSVLVRSRFTLTVALCTQKLDLWASIGTYIN